MEAEICRGVLAIHHASYGCGAGTVTAHILDDVVLVVLDKVELQPSEETLLEAGQDQTVAAVRDLFQETIQATFQAVVERATGRRVVAFTSHLALDDSPFSVEVFRLKPI
jgi:uncharacterized protein YbcI